MGLPCRAKPWDLLQSSTLAARAERPALLLSEGSCHPTPTSQGSPGWGVVPLGRPAHKGNTPISAPQEQFTRGSWPPHASDCHRKWPAAGMEVPGPEQMLVPRRGRAGRLLCLAGLRSMTIADHHAFKKRDFSYFCFKHMCI